MGNLSIEQQFYVDRKRKSPFLIVLVIVTILFMSVGFYFSTVEELAPRIKKVVHKLDTSFLIEEPKKKEPEKPKEEKPKPFLQKMRSLFKRSKKDESKAFDPKAYRSYHLNYTLHSDLEISEPGILFFETNHPEKKVIEIRCLIEVKK